MPTGYLSRNGIAESWITSLSFEELADYFPNGGAIWQPDSLSGNIVVFYTLKTIIVLDIAHIEA